MKTWEIIETVLKKPLEEMVDITTGNWKCSVCKSKKKYFSKDSSFNKLNDISINEFISLFLIKHL